MTIQILNKSTLVGQRELERMVAAVAMQVQQHFAPSWSRLPAPVTLVTQPDPHQPMLVVVDDSDDPEALGYHTEAQGGLISGIVAAKPVLDARGSLFDGPMSISCVLSHEVLETHNDPFCDVWVDAPDGRRSWAFEMCDPVQDDSYVLDGVSVSNFVLGAFFDDMPAVGAKFDWLGRLSGPFSISDGGYAVVRMVHTGAVQQLGYKPIWKPALRHGRSSRRLDVPLAVALG